MNSRMTSLLRLALACAAAVSCRSPSPVVTAPPARPVVAAVDAGSAAPEAPPPPVDLCERLLADHRAALARIADPDAPWSGPLATFGRCLPTPRGAWAVVVDEVTVNRTDDQGAWAVGRWSVVYAERDGATARRTQQSEWASHSLMRVEAATTYDYDGDGEPELILVRHTDVLEGAEQTQGEVLTQRAGAVVGYAPADGIAADEARDVDGDGRPDLVTTAPYRGEGDDTPSGFTYRMEGPALLAHALPDGTFSRDDATAAAFARQQCPRRDPTLGGARPDARAVVCARLWGVSAAAAAQVVRSRCASPAENEGGSPRRRWCGDTRVLLRWIAAPPPLTLR